VADMSVFLGLVGLSPQVYFTSTNRYRCCVVPRVFLRGKVANLTGVNPGGWQKRCYASLFTDDESRSCGE